MTRWGRWSRPPVEEEVRDELGFHLEMRARDLIAEGWRPDDARAEARRRFGNVPRTGATCRALAHERETTMRRTHAMDAARQDVRFAVRHLWRNPGFTVAAVLTLALGVGATTAIFSVVNAVLLRPVPFPDPDRLVYITETWRDTAGGDVSAGNFVHGLVPAASFEAVTAVQSSNLNLVDDSTAERVFGSRVSAAYFDVFPMAPLHGRVFSRDEDEPGREQVVVLSHGLWTRAFGADPGVVGRQLRLSGRPYEVIGVMPAAFDPVTDGEDLWVPIAFSAERRAQFDEHFLNVYGRLKPGATWTQAKQDLVRAGDQVRAANPLVNQDRSFAMQPLQELLAGGSATRLNVWMAAVGLVLLIACGNVANLLLARAASRQGELAVRAALGAGRGRIVRQLVTESLVLSGLATAVGLVIAVFGVRLLVALEPGTMSRLDQASVDGVVFLFAGTLSLACALLFGLWPAWSQARGSVPASLREAGRGAEPGRVSERWGTGLMVAELAIALVLLVGAGVMIRSAIALGQADLGFSTERLWTGRLSLPAESFATGPKILQTLDDLRAHLAALPGVDAVAMTSQVPMGTGGNSNGLLPEGRPIAASSAIDTRLRMVSPGYLEALGVALRSGRFLTDADRRGGEKVMVINATLAAAAFPGEEAVGKRMACCEAAADGRSPDYKMIVGVVADVHWRGPGRPVSPEFYLPLAQVPDAAWSWIQRTIYVVARTSGDPAALTEPIRRVAAADAPGAPLFDWRTMDERRSRSQAAATFNTTLLSILGLLGIVLASVGIYGVMAYFVNRRTREIGVRMALGATRADVLGMVLRRAAITVALGLTLGGIASFWATQSLASQLFNTSPTDPVTFIAVAVLFTVVAGVATVVPALRAASVDPTSALRAD